MLGGAGTIADAAADNGSWPVGAAMVDGAESIRGGGIQAAQAGSPEPHYPA
jgi:hypothetical protein